jgi:ribosome maturation factor RimP
MSATDRQRLQLEQQIGPVVQNLGYELDEIAVSRVGRRSLVRLTVDSDAGIDLDAIADVSRAVSAELDAKDPFDTPFVLEVSSPGIDRPLTLPRHWRRNVGRLVQAAVGEDLLTGRIRAVTDEGVDLSVGEGAGAARRRVRWDDLGPGRVQVEFGRRDPGVPDEEV